MSEVQTKESISLLEYIVINLFDRGSVVIFVEGRRGSGKTNMALKIMEITHKFNLIKFFATNEKMIDPYFQIEYIDSLDDLDSWGKNQYGKKLYILDEAGKAMARRSPMSKLNVQLLQNFQTLRHSDLSLFLICPDAKYIDSASLGTDVLDLRIRKNYSFPSGKPNPKIALLHDQLTNEIITLTGIEETELKYNDKWDCVFRKNNPNAKTMFSDKNKQLLLEWSGGRSCKELGITNMEINRLSRKYVKESLEREYNI